MSEAVRIQQFLADRATCVGGSDIPDLLQIKPYGCRRKLWYDKSQVKADFPFLGNRQTRRGNAMEPFAFADFAAEHPGFLLSPGTPLFKRLEGFPMVGCHADRIIYERPADLDVGAYSMPWGVLETKSPSARVFYAGKNSPEPPAEARLQAIYNAGIHRLRNQVVQWFSSDAWLSRFWDVPNEDGVFDDLKTAAVQFWGTLDRAEPPYEQLPDGDARCNRCPWRGTCKGLDVSADDGQGVELINSEHPLLLGCGPHEANRLLIDYVATRAALKAAEEAHELVKAEIKGVFPGPGFVETPSGRITLRVIRRKGYTPKPVEPTTFQQVMVKPIKVAEDDDVGPIIDE